MDIERIYADALLYDQEFAERVDDVCYYRNLALKAEGTVLEIACGTGRLTIPIAESGKEIVGIDLVASMLERAKENSRAMKQRIEFRLQDCRHFSLERKYNLIFCAANAMQHLLDQEDVLHFLEAVKNHLTAGGLFVFEVFNPDPMRLARNGQSYQKKSFASSAGETRVQCSSRYDATTQVLHFVYTYEANGVQIERKEIPFRCFFPLDLRALLSRAGLHVERCEGNYDGSSFHDKSALQIFHCRTQP